MNPPLGLPTRAKWQRRFLNGWKRLYEFNNGELMILTIDVGNSQIFGGVFSHEGDLLLRFRRTSKSGASSDEIGIFLRSVLRENDLDPTKVDQIGICTVVPEVLHSLRNACVKYFDRNPFVLSPGVKTGLKIRYKNPLEVG